VQRIGHTIALASYGFHEVVWMFFRWLVARRARTAIRAGVPLKWRTLSEDFEKPGVLLAASVLGPRWNCHALLGTLSPILVRETLSVDTAYLGQDSDSWSLVLYDERWTTKKWIDSAITNDGPVRWALPPGTYSLMLRFYTGANDMSVPAVTIDGEFVSGAHIPGEASRYRGHLESIRDRSGLYYVLLNYYVFFHLKHRSKK
jgi:hypothetical protein